MSLSNKREAFIDEYLRDFNATQAAIRAGYSRHTAYSQGARLLKNVEISEEVNRRISEKSMGTDEILLRLAEHARGDVGEFLDIGSMGFVVDLEKAKEKGITHLVKKVKMRTTTTVNREGVETETHDTEIELYNAQDALSLLGKHHRLFVERTEVGGEIKVEGFEQFLEKIYGSE